MVPFATKSIFISPGVRLNRTYTLMTWTKTGTGTPQLAVGLSPNTWRFVINGDAFTITHVLESVFLGVAAMTGTILLSRRRRMPKGK
jgi:hypothetical protein